jgi:site-specific DNA-cytosine methylase
VPPSLPGVLADVTDSAFFTAERVAAWGAADVLVSSIPCTSVSRLGKRDGLKNKAVAAFIVGLLAIVGLAAAPVCIFECTVGLEADPRFSKALLKRPMPLMRNFTENLMAYALGRRVEDYDQTTVRTITRDAERNKYKFSSFVMGVVNSKAFHSKRAEPVSADASHN